MKQPVSLSNSLPTKPDDPQPPTAAQIVADSGFFDPAWYLKVYPDVARWGKDPLEHYLVHGAAELRDPGPRFNARWYAAQWPEDPAAAAAPLLHYLQGGGDRDAAVGPAPAAFEGLEPARWAEAEAIVRSGFFDPDWYVRSNPDVARSGADPLAHYVEFGGPELRDPGQRFVARWYAGQFPDEPRAAAAPLLHYLDSGLPTDAVVAPGQDDPWWGGSPEPDPAALISASGFFDADWYLRANPDVVRSGQDPLLHYLGQGAAELRAPGPKFDARHYAKRHGEEPGAIDAPLLHYLRAGGDHTHEVGRRERSVATALKALAYAEWLDPDLVGLADAISRPHLLVDDGLPMGAAARAWKRLFSTLDRPYRRIIFVARVGCGGADPAAGLAARAVIQRHGPGSLLLVGTDGEDAGAGGDFPAEADIRVLSDYEGGLDPADRADIVAWLIQALEPQSILNVHSTACWEALGVKGAALSTFCDLYVALSHQDDSADRHFRSAIGHLQAAYVDNLASAEALAQKFALPPRLGAKLQPLHWSGLGPDAPREWMGGYDRLSAFLQDPEARL